MIMVIVDRWNFPADTPELQLIRPSMRVYAHSEGLETVFGGSSINARDHLTRTVSGNQDLRSLLKGYGFAVALVWGDAVPRIDFFGFRGLSPWHGQAGIH